MQLKKQTNDAISILLYLTTRKDASGEELSQFLGIDECAVKRITGVLCEKGWITSDLSEEEKFHMAEKPENITLLDVMEVMEGTMKISHSLEEPCGACSKDVEALEVIQFVYQKWQDHVEARLSALTLSSLAEAQVNGRTSSC